MRYLPAHELRLPAGMADQDSASDSSQGGEHGVKCGVGDVEARCTEGTVHFHSNNVVRVWILQGFLVGPEVLPVPCHHVLPCAQP